MTPAEIRQRETVVALIPPGLGWEEPLVAALWAATSHEFARIADAIATLRAEADPAQVTALLTAWAIECGIPDACSVASDDDGLRADLARHLGGSGGNSYTVDPYEAIAVSLGWASPALTWINEGAPFYAGESAAGDALGNDEWVYSYLVQYVTEGHSAEAQAALECQIRQRIPAWISLSFDAIAPIVPPDPETRTIPLTGVTFWGTENEMSPDGLDGPAGSLAWANRQAGALDRMVTVLPCDPITRDGHDGFSIYRGGINPGGALAVEGTTMSDHFGAHGGAPAYYLAFVIYVPSFVASSGAEIISDGTLGANKTWILVLAGDPTTRSTIYSSSSATSATRFTGPFHLEVASGAGTGLQENAFNLVEQWGGGDGQEHIRVNGGATHTGASAPTTPTYWASRQLYIGHWQWYSANVEFFEFVTAAEAQSSTNRDAYVADLAAIYSHPEWAP